MADEQGGEKGASPPDKRNRCRKTLGFVVCMVTQYNGLRSGVVRVARFEFDELRLGRVCNLTYAPYERVYVKGHVGCTRARNVKSAL